MRRTTLVVSGLTMAGLMMACGHPVTAADKVRVALGHTRGMSRRYVYMTEATGRAVSVQGFVEDDLRFQATISVGHNVVLDEVVRDDAVADHFRDPAAVDLFLRPAPTATSTSAATAPQAFPTSGPPTAGRPDRASTAAALRSGRWVIDRQGAPSLIPLPTGVIAGFDPALESMQVFDYVSAAINQAQEVVKFNPEDVAYKPRLDPFPKPGDGVVRYDLRPSPLPRPGTGGSANQAVPDVRNFRKMSVYIKSGVVQAVRETIDVKSRLQDFVRLYGATLPRNATADEQAAFAINVTNNIRKGQGQEPIAIRQMTLTLTDIGAELPVVLPTDAVPGDLSMLADLGTRIRTSFG